MTLPTNVLQSLISRNRETITGLHELVKFWKDERNSFYDCGMQDVARNFNNRVVKYSKDIDKLVIVQKALKQELSRLIKIERYIRDLRCWQAQMVHIVEEMK